MDDFQKFLDENLNKVKFSEEPYQEDQRGTYDIYNEISKAVVSLREESHLTQKELADQTGLTQANISKLEKGQIKPTIETLKRIADATGTRLVVEFMGQEVE